MEEREKVSIVVATNRGHEQMDRFLQAWFNEPFDYIFIIEDRSEPCLSYSFSSKICHFSRKDILSEFPDPEDHIFSFGDSAIKSYGFYKASEVSDYIICLDDDCLPARDEPYLVKEHLDNLTQHRPWVSTVPWLHVRGMPYRRVSKRTRALVSMGLWCGQPDLSSVARLLSFGETKTLSYDEVARLGTRTASPYQWFPFCGMNFAFHSSALPLMYFPPMGDKSPYRRFDDIWAGLLLQKVFYQLHIPIVIGKPIINHLGNSDPLKCLVEEANGIVVNEEMWQVFDDLRISGMDIFKCARSAAESMKSYALNKLNVYPETPQYACREYVALWGKYLDRWLDILEDRE